jgi:hypothetical protein
MIRVSAVLAACLWAAACTSPAPPAGSSPATPAQIEHIQQFLKPGLSLNHAHVARSQAHRNAHLFAAQIVGASQADAVGVWLVSGPTDFKGGTTYSVDAYAKGYSVAPDGSTTKAEISMSDPPATDLQRYVAVQVR